MERLSNKSGLVELGTGSTDTQGQPILAVPEQQGYRLTGLLAD